MAHRIARAGPSNRARKPSPVVLTSRPWNRSSWRRTWASCLPSSSFHRSSPSSTARFVEWTMSVNSTVASTGPADGWAGRR